MKCNGCGADIDDLGSAHVYGDVSSIEGPDGIYNAAVGQYVRTFCPNCAIVIKDILLNSDLSEHWHKYEEINDAAE